jgi:hypothetical protein
MRGWGRAEALAGVGFHGLGGGEDLFLCLGFGWGHRWVSVVKYSLLLMDAAGRDFGMKKIQENGRERGS